MKLLGLLAAQLPIGALAMSASLGVKDSLLAESRERSVSFASLPYDLPSTTLISEGIAMHALKNTADYADILGSDGRIGCTDSVTSKNDGKVVVVLAFSKCLNGTALEIVEQWVNQVKATVSTIAYADQLEVEFQSTVVPGACAELSEKNKRGLDDPAMENQGGAAYPHNVSPVLAADEVLPSDLKRLEAFPGLGTVVNLADDDVSLTVNPIAVISFVTGEKSYGEVVQFETRARVTKTFNFQLCQAGVNCGARFEDCIYLEQTVDLFMYNPFTVTRSLQCAHLDGGVPVTYLDSYGARQCYCACPAGYELGQNKYGHASCTKVEEETCPCVWAQCNGFKHEVKTNEPVCSFTHVASNWGLPVPFPTDGYVADKRDTLTEGNLNPHITLTASREQDKEYKGSDVRSIVGLEVSLPLTFQQVVGVNPVASNLHPIVNAGNDVMIHHDELKWKEYQMNRDSHIDDLEFTSYGKYHLDMEAQDYYSKATCSGCLVIVDQNRPKSTTGCPKNFCDYMENPAQCMGTAEITEANLEKAKGLVAKYNDFAGKATNDACSVNNRCDSESFHRRDFFEDKYKDSSSSAECFDRNKVVEDLLNANKAKKNPLKVASECDNTAEPVPAGQCTRCCQMQTKLKEWWTDYRCGSDYDARYCEGDSSETCEFKQCLVMNGDTLATATACISPDAKTESESVLTQVEDEAYQTVTQIHRALECTSFGAYDGECEFRAKLSELIDTTEQLNFGTDTGHWEATDYVHWRFKIVSEGESWQLWKTSKRIEYGGVVYENDDVLTFSNPETKIVLEAWSQCGLVRRFFFYVHLHVNSPVSVCDKFNDMWYQTSVSRLPIASGMCSYPGSDFAELTFDFHPNSGLQYSRTELKMKVSKVVCTGALENRLPIDILSVTRDSPEIVTRFAVAMLNKATTEASTDFHVECNFTYAKYGGATAVETCKRDFAIKDCKGPAFDTPNAECEYDACGGDEKAGLYEACGGIVVKADEKCTIVETEDKECCQGCGDTEVVCTALLDLPDAKTDIKRCEPAPTSDGGAYTSSYNAYSAVLLTETAQEHPAATALLGATALIAVVALVVVRRRVGTSHSAQTTDDAYYPLLH